MPANLLELLKGVTSGTVWGFASTYWEPLGLEGGWLLEWQYPNTSPGCEFSLYYNPPCLNGEGYYFTDGDTQNKVVFLSSTPNFEGQNCIQPYLTTATGTFTINGIGPLKYYYITGDTFFPEVPYGPPPVPNLLLS